MDAIDEVLTKEKALPLNILPTGRKVGVAHVRGTGMYELKYVDGKGGEVPDEYKSRYTGTHYAMAAAKKFVKELWDISEKASKKK